MKYKYPGGVKINVDKISNKSDRPINYGNRGMDLENDINQSNNYYLEIDRAVIYKKPTPIKITEVDYKNCGKIIKKAFFESPSTTDYNGIYKGKYIDFEAKETKSKTSFPLNNIHPHQIKHMINILNHGGICFLIVRFQTIGRTYILLASDLEKFLNKENRHSIPLSYFEKYGKLIEEGFLPRIDYLKVIDEIYGGVLNEK